MRGPEPREFKQIARRRQQSVSVLRIEFDRADYQNGLMFSFQVGEQYQDLYEMA